MLEEYFKKNGQSFINVSITFSSIVFLANFVLWNHRINTALYFSNVFSLVLSTVMMVMYPNFLYDKYKDVFFGKFNRYAMNAQGLFIHLIPVYLFRNRQTWSELLEFSTIYDASFMLLAYYFIFQHYLTEIYPTTQRELKMMGVIYILLCIFCVYHIKT
jgi:hypothetical protein